eukprot:TRINITY_DN55419_c0_g1_i1.p1 TRINITY_DN55419_c0_g1~~TRINITY_DN55419_c0_g1_i1.p1  ORF type:complete len:533 (+),score=49.80 TRINITY_DN55419_c0_g1_i1:59-1600(+)
MSAFSVCVLGGSLSGLECASKLAAAGVDVHIFRRLHDPSRAFWDKHPIYEYCPRSITVVPPGGLLAAAVDNWLELGLVSIDHSRVVRVRGSGGDGGFFEDSGQRRVRPAVGGFFGFLDGLAGSLPKSARDRPEVFAGIQRSASGSWLGFDLEGHQIGTFNVLICCYDYFMRGTRKASIRSLLESVLPVSASIMRVVAGAKDTCAFSVVASVQGTDDIQFDVAHVENQPEIALAVRNETNGHNARGLPNSETWTLVATPEWTDLMRPTATSRWDKNAVAKEMTTIFSRTARCGTGFPLRPTYHAGGLSCLTSCSSAAFAFDANAGLGFVGDFFVGQGADGALRSGSSLAIHLGAKGSVASVLPRPDDWVPRRCYAWTEDTATLFGAPAGTADHAWPTLQQLASGELRKGDRCMDRYSRRRTWEQDLAWLRSNCGSQKDQRHPHSIPLIQESTKMPEEDTSVGERARRVTASSRWRRGGGAGGRGVTSGRWSRGGYAHRGSQKGDPADGSSHWKS